MLCGYELEVDGWRDDMGEGSGEGSEFIGGCIKV